MGVKLLPFLLHKIVDYLSNVIYHINISNVIYHLIKGAKVMNKKLIENLARLPFDTAVQQLEILESLVGVGYKNFLVNVLIKHVQGVR